MASARDKLRELFIKGYPNLAYHTGIGPEPAANMEDVYSGDPGSAPAGLAGLVMNPKNAKKIADLLRNSTAIEYIAAKYPRLFKLPARIVEEGGFGGMYNPFTKEVLHPGGSSANAVETIGHELTHAVRDRTGNLKDIMTWNGPIDLEETLARRGGATARKTYEKFLELIKEK